MNEVSKNQYEKRKKYPVKKRMSKIGIILEASIIVGVLLSIYHLR
jgi:hypothetical protein